MGPISSRTKPRGARARARYLGVDALEMEELLALLGVPTHAVAPAPSCRSDDPRSRGDDVVSSGTPRAAALDEGDEARPTPPPSALDAEALRKLERAPLLELEAHMGRLAAERLAAAFAIARRVRGHVPPRRPSLRTADRVHRLLAEELAGLERERFLALLLDGKHRLFARTQISVGTLTSSLVHPREVFRLAVRAGAAALICVHNHPSGDPQPSAEDLDVTRRLRDAGNLLGIPVLDHVVIAATGYVSLRERLGW